MTLGATKVWCLLFVTAFLVFSTTTAERVRDKRQSTERDEYEDVPDKPFPGKIQIMPIVQRDTKYKDVSKTVEEIIRELPNDEQYERIGKMLNNSYDAINREVAEGETAYQQKMVMSNEERINSSNRISKFVLIIIPGLFSILRMF